MAETKHCFYLLYTFGRESQIRHEVLNMQRRFSKHPSQPSPRRGRASILLVLIHSTLIKQHSLTSGRRVVAHTADNFADESHGDFPCNSKIFKCHVPYCPALRVMLVWSGIERRRQHQIIFCNFGAYKTTQSCRDSFDNQH